MAKPKKETPAPTDLYAFWHYDQYPYVCGGPVTKMSVKGNVETRNYGPGFVFTPFLILPLAAGEAKMAELKQLEAEYHRAMRVLHAEWKARAQAALPGIK